MALPKTKKLIEQGVLDSQVAAHLDLILEHDTSLAILGNRGEKDAVMPAIEELAGRYGNIYQIKHADSLRGILFDDLPFKTSDFISVNLANDKEFTVAYLDLMASERIKGLADINGSGVLNALRRLEHTCVSRTLLPNLSNVLSATYTKDGTRVRITDLVGIEPGTGEVIKHDVYLPQGNGYIYNGHCFLYERLMNKLNLKTEDFKKLLQKRMKKFEFLNK